jgi:glutamyl-tRNA synthetase
VADANTLPPGFCWRFRVRHSPTFTDQVRGHVAVDLQALGGDFVVWRRDGMPAYQLAVVVDDAAEGVTEVIRGDDLIPSTPRQILLQQALGYPTPRYAHLPLVVGVDGRRLAKRHGDTRLAALRQVQVSAEALVGVLAWSLGWLAEPQPMTPHQLLPIFRWDTLTRTPFVLTPDILARIGYPTSMRDHTSP